VQGRVWTLLALRKEPLSQVEIAELLGVSRSLVSTTVAELTRLGLLRAVGDHRNAPYEAILDVWPTIGDILRNREWMIVETARLALEAAIEESELAEELGEQTPWSTSRMRLLLTMTEMAQALLRILIAIRVPKSIEGFGEWIRKASAFFQAFRS
jgi:DNA-binding transcriptional regulator GbsR (MarR family)